MTNFQKHHLPPNDFSKIHRLNQQQHHQHHHQQQQQQQQQQQHIYNNQSSSFSTNTNTDYLIVHVFVKCKPGTEDAFVEATLANGRQSAKESGIARFDIIQQQEDPTQFVLVEVYKNAGAPAAHKDTEHYKVWRDTVASMMEVPRSAIKYKNIFPSLPSGWDYPEDDGEKSWLE
eukprot:CAMPEP_0184855484 /NCGR_PEP_ID=MMETSP0580-20130426/721_1 /TAXON_ID=1118495 /ORGANISM="Dactyliosolen fragilissimus" /LENGTH=173 /DNA_ID=CAMNT_0027350009 /DNA_START=207 /DNA_END=728 /DNA_ORIENTATION=-